MNNNQNDNNKDPKKKKKQGVPLIILTAILTGILVMMLYQFRQESQYEEITYSRFLKLVDASKVDKVLINSNKLEISLKKGASIYDV